MDNWVEEFEKRNGRKPTAAEVQAYEVAQKSASAGVTPVQPIVGSDQTTQSRPVSATTGQAKQSPQQPQTNLAADGNQTSQTVQPIPNIVNAQPAQNTVDIQQTQNTANAQSAQNAANTPQTPPVNATANAQLTQNTVNTQQTQNAANTAPSQNTVNTARTQQANATVNAQLNTAGGPQQQQATAQNTDMAQQNFAQTAAPQKPALPAAKRKNFFLSPLGITIMAVAVLLIAFVTTGFLTSTSRNSLRNKYNEAVKNNDTKALLALFPKKQTESRFADVGAKELIKSNKSFEDIEKASSNDNFSITEGKHLLFFKNYSLNASTTIIGKGNAPKDGTLTIGDRKVDDNDFKTAFFPGTYKIKLKVKNEFGKAEFTTEVKAGNSKAASLNFDIEDSYVNLPAGPDSIKVSLDRKETDITLSDKSQKIGPLERDRNGRSPQRRLTLNGEYGGVKIDEVGLDQMESDYDKFSMDGKDMLPVAWLADNFDLKKLNPYVKAFAEDWYKAGHKKSKEGLDTLDSLAEETELPDIFADSKYIKNEYKGVEVSKYNPYTAYVGYDNNLYLVANFEIKYTSKLNKSPVTDTIAMFQPCEIVFRLEKDGKMTAIRDFRQAKRDSQNS